MEAALPFDSNGNWSEPPGTLATTGQTITTSQHNPFVLDVKQALTGSVRRSGISPMLANLPMGGYRVTGLANGVASTDAATVGQIANILPIGSVIDLAGPSAPAGWLLCYGQAVSRTDYAALFAAIGTQYGIGDGSTTFNVPDLRGCVTAGNESMGGSPSGRLSTFFGSIAQTLGGFLGVSNHTLTKDQMPVHNHTGGTSSDGAHAHNIGADYIGSGTSSTGGYIRPTGTGATTSTDGEHTHTLLINSEGGGAAHTNAQPTRMMNKIIKAA